MAAEASHPYNNLCHIGAILSKSDRDPGKSMMRGMTAKNFDPAKYSGRWFEVASLKRGFAGTGQQDCHCTQGFYTYDEETATIQVETLCAQGSADGKISGIQGKVQCISDEEKENSERDLENQKKIRQKCYLRFPTLPFIPKQPYDVLATDYDNYALVSGAKDTSFVQIYSRKPNPGSAFIKKYKSMLADFGYDPNEIKDTPQDCNVESSKPLDRLLSFFGFKQTLTDPLPDLALKKAVEFNPLTNAFSTLKKLLDLYVK